VTDEKMLARVRALLAKAESSEFQAEADAFTAKATDLMMQYAIDEAMLQHDGKASTDKVIARQFKVEGYAKAKAQLMYNIVKAFGADMIINRNDRGGWSTISGTFIGWESDLDSIEVLYASLQMQVATDMDREAKRNKEIHGRAFKQAFILGFANEVGSRLRAQRRSKVAEAEVSTPGTGLAVVERSEAVERHFRGLYPKTHKAAGARLSDGIGYHSGVSAGERADIGSTKITGGRKAIG